MRNRGRSTNSRLWRFGFSQDDRSACRMIMVFNLSLWLLSSVFLSRKIASCSIARSCCDFCVLFFWSWGVTVALVKQENNRICWTVCFSNIKVQRAPGSKPQLCFNLRLFFVKCCFPFLSPNPCSTNFLSSNFHSFSNYLFLLEPDSHSTDWNLYLCVAFLIILKPPPRHHSSPPTSHMFPFSSGVSRVPRQHLKPCVVVCL